MTCVVWLPDARLRDAVGEVPGVTFVVDGEERPGGGGAEQAGSRGGGSGRDHEVEMVVAPYETGVEALRRLDRFPALRLVQLQTAGYDGARDLIPDGVRLANATGVHDAATAELAVGLALASLRGLPDAIRGHGTWQDFPARRSLADRRVLVLGYGSIGRAITTRLRAFEAEVTAVARSRRTDDLVGQVHPLDELPGLAEDQDVLVMVLPHDASTHHLVDDALLTRMPDGALVVNVGRGPCLDTDAVLQHAGRLSFALDVTDPEPLPDDHPLWSAPEVLITPHIGGGTSAMLPRVVALVRAQAGAFAAGREPRNLVG